MNQRRLVKWLHWLAFGLVLWFLLTDPAQLKNQPPRPNALPIHAGLGLTLALISLIWTLRNLRHGLLGRPGPKLPGWGRLAHRALNGALAWALPIMVVTGGLTALSADKPINAFGLVPLSPDSLGAPALYLRVQGIHEFAFDVVITLVVLHAGLHIWRHFWLRDNALRIMAPRAVHRFL